MITGNCDMHLCFRLGNEYLVVYLTVFVFLVIEGKGGRFSGGFDINVFEKVHKTGMSY